MYFQTILSLFVLLLVNLASVRCQNHLLKTVAAGKNPNTSPWTIKSIEDDPNRALRRNTGSRFTNAAQVCAYGMWALYSEPDFGEGVETTTTATSVRGFETGGTCASTSTYPQLKNVKSVKYLGNLDPIKDGLEISSEKNFLGAFVKITELPAVNDIKTFTPINGIRLGSLAITGKGRWRLCSDAACTATVICIDNSKQHGNLYMNRMVAEDKSVPWPTYVRAYTQLSAEDCSSEDYLAMNTRN